MFLYGMLKINVQKVQFVKPEGKAANSKLRRKE